MNESSRHNQNRRQLFAGVLRYAALGLLAAGGAALIAKRRYLIRKGVCINSGICNGCAILRQCALPEALSAKKISAGVNSGRR